MRRPLARADDTDRISWLRARQLLDHALAGPLPLFQEHQEIGHLLPVRPLVELLDDVGADLAGGGQDPKEIPTRRRSETVSEASRILPKHRGASVSAPGAQSSNDGHADDTGGDATGTHMAEGGSTLLHALMFPESAADRIGGYGSAASTARLTELFEHAQRDPALRAVLVGMLQEPAHDRETLAARSFQGERTPAHEVRQGGDELRQRI